MSEAALQFSPLQLKQLLFKRIHVEANSDVDRVEELWGPGFDFSGTKFETNLSLGVAEGQETDPRNFLVTVRLSISNTEEKSTPYNVDIEAVGEFELAPIYPVSDREAIVHVNGASMIVGVIREMIAICTARSVFGQLTLPTLRFVPPEAASSAAAESTTSSQES